jgi:hypothetical protein
LAIFDENEREFAEKSTYETLDLKYKLNLGPLSPRAGRTILLSVEKYGLENDIIEFTTKPIRWINFKEIIR